ncbi:Zinc finger CCCH-type [Arabidopsis suecica]|uniref:Zinc finger CCCH-type n=1 Tax=Arabidopsis suecica TaxID=45249 RepID=A0A8T2FBT4_ARASU|nr:Zinc finger CCCH-type [Arabidopsis suecica]
MNPLTQVKNLQKINARESDLGISDEASWHAKYKNSAYVYVGGIPFDLTEGDLLAVFSQYGEIVDVNLIRDKGTGKSKGFAFLAYEDQRSTILAVDNLNGALVLGRTIKVDHCGAYKKHEEEDEETRRQNREARGVCRAFQRGECTRGDSCKFSHDEKRAANTGWGHEEDRSSKWDHDKNREGRGVCRAFQRGECTRGDSCKFSHDEKRAANTGWGHEEDRSSKWDQDKLNGAKKGGISFGNRGDFKPDVEEKSYRGRGDGDASYGRPKERERVDREDMGPRSRDAYDMKEQKRSGRYDNAHFRRHNDEIDYIREDKGSRTQDWEKRKAESRRDRNDREEKDRDSLRREDRRR